MKSKLLLFLIVIFFSACNQNQNKKGIFIGENQESYYLKDFISNTVKLVAIEEDDSLLIGEFTKLLKTDSAYYVLDQMKTKALYKVSTKGNILSSFHHVGNGPNEYVHIYDFDIDKKNNEILILCYPNKIIVTDLDYNIKRIHPLKDTYGNVACHLGKIYLYGKDRTLFSFNPKTEEVTVIICEGKLNQVNGYSYDVFHRTQDELLFIAHCGDKIYSLQDGKARLKMTLDFKNKKERYKLMAGEQEIARNKISMFPPHIYSIYKAGSKKYCILYSDMIFRICIFDTQKQTVIKDGPLISFPLPGDFTSQNINDNIVANAFGRLDDIRKLFDANYVVTDNSKKISTETEESNVLIFYKMNEQFK